MADDLLERHVTDCHNIGENINGEVVGMARGIGRARWPARYHMDGKTLGCTHMVVKV